MKIACEKPVVVFHPNVLFYLQNAHAIHYPTHTKLLDIDDIDCIYNESHGYLIKNFPPCKSVENPDEFFIIDENGEIFNVYMQVPCNQCPCCIATRMNSYKQQLEFELLDSCNYPETTNLFVTFTYRDKFLPYRKSLDKPAFQRFLKRIRKLIATELSPQDSQNIKVLYSGEYGTKGTKRPHYHCCFLHFPLQKLANKYDVAHARLIFEYCWSEKPNGNVKGSLPFSQYNVDARGFLNNVSQYFYKKYVIGMVRVCDILDGNIGSYVAKYVTKTPRTKQNKKTPCYVCKSRNLGLNYVLNNIAKEVYKRKKNTFHYLNLDGKVEDNASLCSYYIGKLFPTISRIVSSEYRKMIWRVKDSYYELSRRNYTPKSNYTILWNKMPYLNRLVTYIGPLKYTREWHKEYGKNIIRNICQSSKSIYEAMFTDVQQLSEFFTDEFLTFLDTMKKRRDEFIYNTIQDMPPLSKQMDMLKQQYIDMKLSIKL